MIYIGKIVLKDGSVLVTLLSDISTIKIIVFL